MAALNFPPSPSTNQIYSANGKSWRFDGTSWKTFYILNVQGGGTGNTFYNLGDILVGAGTSLYPFPVGSNNFVLTVDTSAAFGITWRSTAATGITTLNYLTDTSQYFAVGTSGTGFNISSSGSTHTFNVPIAGAGATGLISTDAQTIAGQKTFTSAIIGDLTGTATTAGFALTASYSDQSGYGITAGFANTASYAYQSGYGITSGFATTASYSYQSGYGLTSGFATTASYSYQSGYGLTSGFATTAANLNVSNAASGVFFPLLSNTTSSTSGIGASVNSFFSFNAATGAFGATSVNILSGQSYSVGGNSVLSATSLGTGVTNSSLTALGTITTGIWAGSLITEFYGGTGYNSYTKGDILVGAGSTLSKLSVGTNNFILVADNTAPGGIKWANASGLAITNINGLTASKQDLAFGYSGTVPEFTSSGSTHTLNIPLAGTGSTGLVSTQAQSFSGIKTFTNAVSITDTTASVSYTSGAITVTGGVGIGGTLNVQGDLNVQGTFTTINSTTITVADKNIELGVVASPSDLTAEGGGITLRGATNKSINWYSGVGWSSSESLNLASGNTYKIGNTSVLSSTSLGTGVTNSSLIALGTISTGVWAGSLITGLYGGTGYNSYTKGDILVGAGSTFIKLNVGANDYVLTANSSSATGLTWSPTAAVGITTLNGINVGTQTLATGTSGAFFNISSVGSSHTFNIPIAGTGATGLVTTLAQSFSGVKTFTNDTVISSSTVSTSTSTGALTVTGGVGIGGSLYTGTSTADSISGVVLNNGVITSGAWAGTLITALYGGTGYNSYTLGDFLVGAGSTFIKLPVGINSYVLGADSSKPSGVGWTTVTPLTVSDTAPASPKNADLWFNSVDGGLLVYYTDVNTNQWVEIALGSGIDLSQPVHITNTTASTSTSTGALIVDGGVGVAGTVYASSFSVNGIYDQISSTLVTSATTANQVAFSINSSSFRTAKIIVQVTSGSNYHSQEILMVHDDSQVYMTEYAMVNTGAIGSTFDGDISGGNIRFLVTPTNAVTTYKIACSVMRI